MPLWARYVLGAVVAALIAVFLSPVFPGPLDVICYWLAWIVALILAVLAVFALIGQGRTRI